MSDQQETPAKTFLGQDVRAVKLAVYGFFIVLLVCMLAIKPYLPSAFYHNFARIDDYRFFQNRVVLSAEHKQPWGVSEQKMPDPKPETLALLKSLETTALLVIENGKIVYERYDGPKGGPSGVDEISGSFSMAKSIIALLTGFAAQDGAIRNLDEPIGTYINEWSGMDEGRITIKQLLQMTSGLNWDESYWNPFSITTEAYYGTDLHRTVLRQRLIREPGTMYSYESGTTQLLGLVVARATQKNLATYASEKMWQPMGAEHDALWSLDHESGMEKAYCCFNATARDFARFGQLVLQNGSWNGTRLLNEEYVKTMITPHEVKDESGNPVDYYGYQWWNLRTPQGGRIPYARGILGQYIVVVPQKKRVIVRLGMKRGKTVNHHPEEVWALVEWAQ
ncbi:MAG: serine hydrolase [Bdellovibrionales bacterium]|nr:serine hydrolase [Bdellovibrionales bacterium]